MPYSHGLAYCNLLLSHCTSAEPGSTWHYHISHKHTVWLPHVLLMSLIHVNPIHAIPYSNSTPILGKHLLVMKHGAIMWNPLFTGPTAIHYFKQQRRLHYNNYTTILSGIPWNPSELNVLITYGRDRSGPPWPPPEQPQFTQPHTLLANPYWEKHLLVTEHGAIIWNSYLLVLQLSTLSSNRVFYTMMTTWPSCQVYPGIILNKVYLQHLVETGQDLCGLLLKTNENSSIHPVLLYMEVTHQCV